MIPWLTVLSLHWHRGQGPVGDLTLPPGGTLVTVGGHHPGQREPRVPRVLGAGRRGGQRGPTEFQILAYNVNHYQDVVIIILMINDDHNTRQAGCHCTGPADW